MRGYAGQNDAEFFAADTADHIRFPHAKFEQPRQALDHPVADLMAVDIVDPLEEVDIDDRERQRMSIGARAIDFAAQQILTRRVIE